MDATKHTATPALHLVGYHTNSGHLEPFDGYTIMDQHSNAIADMPKSYFGNGPSLKANAQFIVRACNSHQTIIDALHDAAIAADIRLVSREQCQALIKKLDAVDWSHARNIAARNALEAIAKAGGQ